MFYNFEKNPHRTITGAYRLTQQYDCSWLDFTFDSRGPFYNQHPHASKTQLLDFLHLAASGYASYRFAFFIAHGLRMPYTEHLPSGNSAWTRDTKESRVYHMVPAMRKKARDTLFESGHLDIGYRRKWQTVGSCRRRHTKFLFVRALVAQQCRMVTFATTRLI